MIDSLEKIAEDRFLPNRAYDCIDQYIDDLMDIIDGRVSPLLKGEAQKRELIKFESGLYHLLSEINKLKIRLIYFYPAYFFTAPGRKMYRQIFGRENRARTIKSLVKNLYLKRYFWRRQSYRENFAGWATGARRWVEKNISRALQRAIDERTGEIKLRPKDLPGTLLATSGPKKKYYSLGELVHPERITIIVNPDLARRKIKKLISFKKDLKKWISELDYQIDNRRHNTREDNHDPKNKLESINLLEAKKLILFLYKKKINVMIVNTYYVAAAIYQMKETIGISKLAVSEKEIIRYFENDSNYEKILSQVDKFVFGASRGYSQGERKQLSQKLINFSRQLAKKYVDNEIKKGRKTAYFQAEYPVKSYIGYLDKLLDSLKLSLSRGAGGWTYVIDPDRLSFGVSGLSRKIICDTHKKSLYEIFAVLLGHEMTHVLQHHNRQHGKIKLLVGGVTDRHYIFAEAGAKMMENRISQKLFSVKNLPHPYYIAAMQRRLAGGNYFDCVLTFYQSMLANDKKINHRAGRTEEKKRKYQNYLKIALHRVHRIFRPMVVDLNSHQPYLTSSKDALYLEQLMLIEALKKYKMEHMTMIGGVNLENLFLLAKIGLVDQRTISNLTNTMQDEKLIKLVKGYFDQFIRKHRNKK
ncbi:MAG: hypothetical protein WC570_03970 [Patescibacteria group bacterium]